MEELQHVFSWNNGAQTSYPFSDFQLYSWRKKPKNFKTSYILQTWFTELDIWGTCTADRWAGITYRQRPTASGHQHVIAEICVFERRDREWIRRSGHRCGPSVLVASWSGCENIRTQPLFVAQINTSSPSQITRRLAFFFISSLTTRFIKKFIQT
jgi:hypothetical protein